MPNVYIAERFYKRLFVETKALLHTAVTFFFMNSPILFSLIPTPSWPQIKAKKEMFSYLEFGTQRDLWRYYKPS